MVEQVEREVLRAPAPAWRVPPLPFELSRALSSRRVLTMAGLGCALGLGLVARLPHILATDFPVNDGGMFFSMVRDIQSAHYLLPSHASYNSESIPFVYPPFPFYLAAAIDNLTPASLTDIFRFLPLAANLLTIVVVYYLARRILGSRTVAPELAAIIFALLPRGYRWLIMGGGLTRSLAFLFALLALHEAYLVFRERKTKHLVMAAAFGALTVLSHPEVAYFLGFSFVVLLACYGLRRQALLDSLLLCVAVALLTAPWWASALARDGFAPFYSAARTGGQSGYVWWSFFYWDFTELSVLNWPAVLALLGAVICISQGEFFLPGWLVVSVVLEPRSGPTYTTVPIAMMSGLAIARFVLPLAQKSWLPAADGTAQAIEAPREGQSFLAWLRETGPGLMKRAMPLCAVALFLFYIGFISVREVILPDAALDGLTAQDRAAFQWVKTNTPTDSKFVIMSGDFSPFTDEVSEWFPALTKRQSLATLQGYEWLGDDRYLRQWDNFEYLQSCQDVYCLDSWMAETRSSASYVYVARDCCPDLERSLRSSRSYTMLYDGPSATIFSRRGNPTA